MTVIFSLPLHTIDEHYFKTHIAKHKSREEFKCTSCEIVFLSENELIKHNFTVHEGHKDGKCAICHRQFNPKHFTALKKHVRDVHENADRKNHLCTLCGRSFKHSNSLRDHILSVSCLKYLLYNYIKNIKIPF